MDIIFNLILVFGIVILFILMKYTVNPYLYVGIIILAITGLVISVSSPLYTIIGYNSSVIFDANKAVGVVTYPITQNYDTYNYILQLFYLMSIIGSVIFWNVENPKEFED